MEWSLHYTPQQILLYEINMEWSLKSTAIPIICYLRGMEATAIPIICNLHEMEETVIPIICKLYVKWSLKSTAIPNICKVPVYGMKFEIHNKFYYLQTMWNEAWNPQQILFFANYVEWSLKSTTNSITCKLHLLYVKWSLKFTEIPIIWKSTTNSTICKLHGMKL